MNYGNQSVPWIVIGSRRCSRFVFPCRLALAIMRQTGFVVNTKKRIDLHFFCTHSKINHMETEKKRGRPKLVDPEPQGFVHLRIPLRLRTAFSERARRKGTSVSAMLKAYMERELKRPL